MIELKHLRAITKDLENKGIKKIQSVEAWERGTNFIKILVKYMDLIFTDRLNEVIVKYNFNEKTFTYQEL